MRETIKLYLNSLTGKLVENPEHYFQLKNETTTDNAVLTINGVTKPINEKATLVVKDAKISLTTKFNITLTDYEVAFEKGKPSKNIAKTVEVSVEAYY